MQRNMIQSLPLLKARANLPPTSRLQRIPTLYS